MEIAEKCHCGGRIDWIVVRAPLGAGIHKGLCKDCNSVYTDTETPDHRAGKELSKRIGVVKWNDKRITSMSVDAQVGYFRSIQHCTTCRNAIGVKCNCTDCDCIYCKNK